MLSVTDQKPMAQVSSAPLPTAYTVTALPAVPTPHGVTLEDIWRKLVRQKWVFLPVMLATILLAAFITWSIQPTYRSMATLQIEKEGVQVVNFGSVNNASPDMGELDPFFRTQYEQLKSRKLAESVMSDLGLQQHLFEHKQKPGMIRSLLSGIFPSTEEGENKKPVSVDYTAAFINGLYVEPIEKTHLVKVFYESPDPVLSAQIVNTLVNNFIKTNINSQSETDAYAKEFLERELDKARTRLTMQDTKLVEYAKSHDILEVNNSQSTQEKKLDDLYAALGEAERNRIQTESQMIQGRKHGNVSQVLDSPVVEGLKSRLSELEARYQDQLKIFKPNYPDMQSLDQQIQEIRRQLSGEVGNIKQSLDSQFLAAKKLEDDLRNELENYKQELVGLRDRSIEYDALKREVETSRNLYEGLLQRVKEVNVAANASTSNIRVVDPAAPATDMFRPNRKLNMIIGSLVGLLLGFGAALLRETLNQTVASITELQALSGLPILGTIPRMRNMAESTLALSTARDMASPFAEAYRVAAANLRFILPEGFPRVTLITSVNPAEGKSTSATNIALSQAQTGMKVLLIDADLRRPSLHFKLGLPNAKGLSNFLAGETDIANATQPSREVKGLYIITAGTLMVDPVRMLSSPAMAKLVNLAIQHFDSIIIDGPPVTGFADAIFLSSLAQATVLVADEDHINRKRLLNTIEQLRRVKQNIAGFLMIRSQEDVVDYRYYDRYQRKPCAEGQKALKGKPRKGLNLAGSAA
jgi:capsular exopolysaccharide synthesis family protein